MAQGHVLDIQIKGDWPVEADLIQRTVLAALIHQDVPPVAVTVVVSDDTALQDLNNRFRGVDAPTDVLAFPNQPQGLFDDADGQPLYLGDVVVSYPRAEEQASQAGHSVMPELQLLVVHGVLHLLGHDDQSGPERTLMWETQEAILSSLGVEINLPD